jgi:pimeloyl-ACP methyl ester carboxylesterase
MSAITHRTLILWGAEDYFIPVSMAHLFARDLPNDTLVIVPNTGHVPMEELPEETAAIVMGFLSKN